MSDTGQRNNYGAARSIGKALHGLPVQRHLTMRHWFDIGTSAAPERTALFAKARDPSNGEHYRLPFKVYRQGVHFYHAVKNNPLTLEIVEWSYDGAKE